MTYLKSSATILLSLFMLSACDEDKETTPPAAAKRETPETRAVALTPENSEPKKVTASAQKESGAGTAADCPQGTWRYDYSDQALEAILSNMPGAKVTKEEGAYVCTLDGETKGTLDCHSDGDTPVINEIQANQAGMEMSIHMEMSGGTTSKFKIDGDKLIVSGTDMSGFDFKVTASLAGRKIPFPAKDFVMGFAGKGEEVTLSYKCEENKLMLLQQAEGTKTDWQTLVRAD